MTVEALARARYEDACRGFADTPDKLAAVQARIDAEGWDPKHWRDLVASARWVLERAAELSGQPPSPPAPRRRRPVPDQAQGVLL